jgi:hypothetical protein
VVNVPGTGAQRLLDRVQTVQNLHPSSVRKSRLVSNLAKNPFLQLVPEGYPKEIRNVIFQGPPRLFGPDSRHCQREESRDPHRRSCPTN